VKSSLSERLHPADGCNIVSPSRLTETKMKPIIAGGAAVLTILLAGCAGMEDPANARSTCHTSRGEYVNVPTGCSISWSSSTTTTTTTTAPAQTKPVDED
jgi:multidrug efflux pump subunit AcrA (membrane-fusion protein)